MTEEPVEILVQMAERGEIDPWNIDIVEVTDRFLSELERRRELDLRISGRTLFFAAILLRMKSEALEMGEEEEEGEPLEDEDGDLFSFGDDDEEPGTSRESGPIDLLEREISRRLDRKKLRKSPITLFELIIELKNAEKEQRRRHRFRSPFSELITAEDVVAIAHDEEYKETAEAVMEQCEDHLAGEEVMTLREIAALLGKGLLDIYIPLLFLMSEGRVMLWQEEFFGEIFVQASRVEAE
ncbi:segregation and condensation protein A [Methanolinea mesophila]|uniref:segregation/condensation protein A n=1 Tax=Methanolinea mesophila TaxID=547055 RepID=UPI001AE80CDD|nr:segregation/condensation protein A [Methanolinea mesophila]MBP1929485.1 segregation and condensation protein A [Methanolinea mesophila]